MFSSKSSVLYAFLLVLVAFFVATATSAQDEPAKSESQIQVLLIEKRDVLASKLEYIKAQNQQGNLPITVVLDAEMDVLDAKLALTESAANRITILQTRLENRRSKESILKDQYKAAIASFVEQVDATVQRIDAEIDLGGEAKEQ